MLSQWLCLGRVVFGESTPEDIITTIIEFVRLADMCGVTGMESLMAGHIKEVIIANSPPPKSLMSTGCLTSQHIILAASLPAKHPVRCLLAAATVEGYFLCDKYEFSNEAEELHNFSVDLLQAVKANLQDFN